MSNNSGAEGILHAEKRHVHSYEATYGQSHQKGTPEDKNKTVSKELLPEKQADPAEPFGLCGEFGDHEGAKRVDPKERLSGSGEHVGSHDPFSMLDKKDKAAIHDALLGAEDKSHMPYIG